MKAIRTLSLFCLSFLTIQAAQASKLEDFAITKLQSMFDAVGKAMPKITEAVLQVTSTDCLLAVIRCQLLLLPAIFAGVVVYVLCRNDHKLDSTEYGASVFFGFIIGLFTIIWIIVSLCNWWEWVGIFHPDMYLLHKALMTVGVN